MMTVFTTPPFFKDPAFNALAFNASAFNASARIVAALLLLAGAGFSVGAAWAEGAAGASLAMERSTTTLAQASPAISPTQPAESEWRAPLLAEMERMATDLDLQRRLNILLEDKVDYLTARIDRLEQRTIAQAKRIEALQSLASKADQQAATPNSEEQSVASSKAPEASEPEASPPETPSAEARKSPEAGLGTTPPKAEGPDKQAGAEKDGKAMDEFERFLDLGEAMMRRFFGVVREFRKDFDDSRA
ncbi:hypothetical protein [uncultured Cohaesibacter sp.]|uniref:hypothetical protein n=1 Tax=uncultured Cohaesibacter sp. TaxID=1002546 RepID=UPI0029C6B45A|nr:hypothetical protein [uncultured Cohaesibacter sp.]